MMTEPCWYCWHDNGPCEACDERALLNVEIGRLRAENEKLTALQADSGNYIGQRFRQARCFVALLRSACDAYEDTTGPIRMTPPCDYCRNAVDEAALPDRPYPEQHACSDECSILLAHHV